VSETIFCLCGMRGVRHARGAMRTNRRCDGRPRRFICTLWEFLLPCKNLRLCAHEIAPCAVSRWPRLYLWCRGGRFEDRNGAMVVEREKAVGTSPLTGQVQVAHTYTSDSHMKSPNVVHHNQEDTLNNVAQLSWWPSSVPLSLTRATMTTRMRYKLVVPFLRGHV
jgi:hypothetical protein